MICLPDTKLPRVVIVGGGFAGLALVDGLKDQPVQVVLIDRNNFHQFQPLLYQVATSGLEPDSILFPFRKQISGYKNVIFRMADVTEIQPSNKTILTDKGSSNYDYLVVATGTTNNYFGMNQIEQQSLGLKDIREALDIRHKMLQNLEQAAITCDQQEQDALTNFVIVGGGPAGVEMAGALAEFCKYILPKDYPEYPSSMMKIYLIEASNQILPVLSEKASAKALTYLQELHVEVVLNESVIGYDGTVVQTQSQRELLAKNLIWTAGVKAQYPAGLTTQDTVTRGNRIKVNEFLQVAGFDKVFALGDMAAVIADDTLFGHPQVA
ncbi:MAG: FAD-dependent oxidoreductase, partial [Candidatus Marinimicrobia bacterium]|nr:FAD-dependent oxidoreductase [Candidatus Neomarinimicrobiota bacterium]